MPKTSKLDQSEMLDKLTELRAQCATAATARGVAPPALTGNVFDDVDAHEAFLKQGKPATAPAQAATAPAGKPLTVTERCRLANGLQPAAAKVPNYGPVTAACIAANAARK